MTAANVHESEHWPVAGALDLRVLDDDGRYGRVFGLTGAEVTILGSRVDGRRLIIPLAFATLDQALRAGALLTNAFDEVRTIQAETPPDPAACGHSRVIETFISRSVAKQRICALCGAHLGEITLDEIRARDRGDGS